MAALPGKCVCSAAKMPMLPMRQMLLTHQASIEK